MIEIIESLRITEHDECPDCFYSCPKHADYCGTGDECSCGLEENNAKIDEALKIIKEMST